MSDPADRMLTVFEVTEELGVSRSTFYQWRQLGRAPLAVRLPNGKVRIRRSALDAWLSELEDSPDGVAPRKAPPTLRVTSGMGQGSFDVRIWKTRTHQRQAGRSYEVRWVVAGSVMSRSFRTRALADGFRSGLVGATRRGERFDLAAGIPVSEVRCQTGPTWYEHARAYAAMKWPRLAAKSRSSLADALATVTPVLVSTHRGAPSPQALRRSLYGWAFNPARQGTSAPPWVGPALRWVERSSLPVATLHDLQTVRAALDALAVTLTGHPAAATTVRRKRAVFNNALRYAVERRLLPSNPLDIIQWTVPQVADQVDQWVVANPDQVRALLDAVRSQGPIGRHLVAFFGCLYYAAMRPGEALLLRRDNCVLPDTGWGSLTLEASAPRAGAPWTDGGQAHDTRGLKHRAGTDTRVVPVPPVLGDLLLAHIAEFDTASDGRLFRTQRGGILQESSYGAVWRQARTTALTADQQAVGLAHRPYDLRHAGVSLWLNSGVPAAEVARRAGHSVAVLLNVYAKCVQGQEHQANNRIEDALGQ